MTMRYRIKITEKDFLKIRSHFNNNFPKEAAVFILTGVSVYGDQTDILVRRIIEIEEDSFDIQERYQLRIAPRAINGLMALCEAGNVGAGFCHSHPEDIPYSFADTYGENRLSETARSFCPQGIPFTSILFYPKGIIGARVWLENKKDPVEVDEIMIVGRSIRKINFSGNAEEKSLDPEMFSRQILALGEGGQAAIESMKVGIVGVGGTGSACAEQLARLGVKDFILLDGDPIEKSNLTRVYGSFPFDESDPPPKVNVVRDHLIHINPEINTKVFFSYVQNDNIALHLRDRDIIFLCTDDHWGRAIINQICYQYLIPTINMGVRIDSRDNHISAGVATVDVLRPDKACLWCKKAIDPERIAAEALPTAERASRGSYVQGLDTKVPMVISFTTLAASMAISCFLQMATDYLGEDGDSESHRYLIMDNVVSRGITPIAADKCICKKVKGMGDLIPIQ